VQRILFARFPGAQRVLFARLFERSCFHLRALSLSARACAFRRTVCINPQSPTQSLERAVGSLITSWLSISCDNHVYKFLTKTKKHLMLSDLTRRVFVYFRRGLGLADFSRHTVHLHWQVWTNCHSAHCHRDYVFTQPTVPQPTITVSTENATLPKVHHIEKLKLLRTNSISN